MTQQDYECILLALCLWREARGETVDTKRAVAWSIRNRVNHKSWWGGTWSEVITKREQYSSMTSTGDPNLVKWPIETDTSWMACMDVATEVYGTPLADPSNGATHYFDKSLDANPPNWASTGTKTADIGNFHFYRSS